MSLPDLSGGFTLWCGTALFSLLVVVFAGIVTKRYTGSLYGIITGIGSLVILFLAVLGGNHMLTLPLPLFLGDAAISLTFDPLSRWFLGLIGIIGMASSLFAPGYIAHLKKRISTGFFWSAFALLLISMSGVVLAANVLVFLVAWELMALSSFALVATDHERHSSRRAALIYLGATRIGTAFLMAGFLWAHQSTGSWNFTDWHISGMAALLPALLILIGLATKAGCWPFHLWLPIAHPAAPAPVSAIMSGVMIKTAIYMIVRLFVLGDHFTHPALGPLILIFGAISAFWGVIFALLQHDLKRLLAYHSVENIGIILMGVGISLIGIQQHIALLAQIGLAAALFHTLNHAVFKSLLFFGAGAIDAQTHQRDMEHLGGLAHKMPWTAAAFITGSAAICALPPLNGFASEWILYQGFFHLALGGGTMGMRLGALLLMGWLALIGALALACFVKVVGVVFLGTPRGKAAAGAKEVSPPMLISQLLLAALCVGLGLAIPVVLAPVSVITETMGSSPSLASIWTIPMPLLALLLMCLVLGIASLMYLAAKRNPVRRFITWECGFGSLGARTQYTATSFAQPISRMFGAIYRYSVDIKVRGRNRRHFPDQVGAGVTHEPYLETRVYGPMLGSIKRVAGSFILRLQSGSIHQYLLYMAIVLALLLWVGYRR